MESACSGFLKPTCHGLGVSKDAIARFGSVVCLICVCFLGAGGRMDFSLHRCEGVGESEKEPQRRAPLPDE